jgi:hypothetical protein
LDISVYHSRYDITGACGIGEIELSRLRCFGQAEGGNCGEGKRKGQGIEQSFV